MSRFLTVSAGRTAKFVVLAVCLVALVVSGAANLPGKYTDAENNESTSFLPSDAESTEVLRITEELQGGEQAPVVIVYRREGGLSAEDQARIAADREELNAGGRGEPRRHLPCGLAVRRAAPVGVRRRRAADRQHHGRRRRRDDPRPGRRHPRARQRPRRRARGQGHRPGRLRGRRDQGVREHQRDAARLGAAARRIPAGPDLPQPDLPLDTAVRGRVRGGRDALDRLWVDGDRRHGQRAVVRDPLDPGARRRHGLRAAAGLALSRGAAQARGQARGDGARAAHRRPRDRRVRRDGDLRAAVPHDRRGRGHGGARADRRARDRGRDGHDAHAAAGAARDLRPARVLASPDGSLGQRHPALRRRGRRRDTRHLAPRRRAGGAQSAEDLDRAPSRCSPSARWACSRSTPG